METGGVNKNGASRERRIYRFDDFVVDPANRLCLQGDRALPITGKAFEILLAFLENPGRLMEKDELLERVWTGEFVEEGNLARNVSTLRKALGDTGKNHKYILTVQGRGYRFVADVQADKFSRISDSTQELPLEDADEFPGGYYGLPETDDRYRSRLVTELVRRPLLVSVAMFCLLGAAVVSFRLAAYRPLARELVTFEHLQKSRLTQDGDVFEPEISPDGQYLAFVRIKNNESALCLRQIATGSVLELEPPRSGIRYWALAFSPDDHFLYYILKEKDIDYGNLYRIPLIGNQPPVRLAQHVNGGLAVSSDGRQLAATRIDRQAGISSIVLLDSNGGNERTVGAADLDSMYYSLDWSPDAASLVYSFKQHENNRDSWYIAEIPVAGGPEVRIGPTSDTPLQQVKWLPDKSGLILNAIDENTRQPQIFNVSYPDCVRHRVTNDLNSYVGFSLTADGRSIVIPQINSDRQIWETSPSGGGMPSQLLSGSEKHFDNVTWSKDDLIVFDEDSNSSFDKFDIFRVRADGSDLQQLTFGPGSNSDPTVSPDGQTIVFVSDRTGQFQLWRMKADGHDQVALTDVPNEVVHPVFSPDGQRIYFSVSDAGQCHIWQVPAAGGAPSPVLDADVYRWAISPDGLSVAYSSFDARKRGVRTHLRRLDNGEEAVYDVAPETWVEWSADGRSLFYNTSSDGSQNIWRLTLEDGKQEPVTWFNDQQIFRFSSSRDGRTLACIRHNTKYDALMLRFD